MRRAIQLDDARGSAKAVPLVQVAERVRKTFSERRLVAGGGQTLERPQGDVPEIR